MLILSVAFSLPLYAERSGRTCANCHESPTLDDPAGWENPEVAARKCTLSCAACHVDPLGGGQRTASGRYFARSTLGMVALEDRGYGDLDKELLPPSTGGWWKRTFRGDLTTAGRHAGAPIMAPEDGRFGSLRADPVVAIGADARFAYTSKGGGRLFPMQLDLHGALHPVHHVTLATTAAWGREGPFLRRATAMLHELPYGTTVRIGAFQPAVGARHEDHTSPTRSLFEGSASTSRSTVTGVDVGIAANYLHANVNLFANDASWAGSAEDVGYGVSGQAGWRALGWSLAAHGQVRRRRRAWPGDLVAGGLSGGWTLFGARRFPVTFVGEATVGERRFPDTQRLLGALMLEGSVLLANGVVARGRSDVWSDATWDHEHRVVLGVTPVPGLEIQGFVRTAPARGWATDAFAQLHLSR